MLLTITMIVMIVVMMVMVVVMVMVMVMMMVSYKMIFTLVEMKGNNFFFDFDENYDDDEIHRQALWR